MSLPMREPNERAEAAAGALSIQSIALPTRLKLQYVAQGDPTGVPILLLHGFTDSWRSFELVLPRLPASVRALALTQRGHGDAERPTSGYGPRDFAADLAAFMDVLGLERAIVVGHSMGSVVAQRFALDYPGRIVGLVLVSWRGRPRPSVVAAMASLADPIAPAFVREFVAASFAQPPPETVLDAMVRESLRIPARVWRSVSEDFLADGLSAELGKIAVPTLIVWGDQDLTCPGSEQEALAATIPGARLLVYPGAGHSPHWEEPARFSADVVAFVAQVTG